MSGKGILAVVLTALLLCSADKAPRYVYYIPIVYNNYPDHPLVGGFPRESKSIATRPKSRP
ncbi:MAG: hypothetical protein GF414_00510 [Candidatus Altiarchaeales archaeon]|nr:hypothetical protein [Candidatus Altiarchaeales archaeon]